MTEVIFHFSHCWWFFHNCRDVWMSSAIADQQSPLFLKPRKCPLWLSRFSVSTLRLLACQAFHAGFHWQVAYLTPSFCLRNSNYIILFPILNKYSLFRFLKQCKQWLMWYSINKFHIWCWVFVHKCPLSYWALDLYKFLLSDDHFDLGFYLVVWNVAKFTIGIVYIVSVLEKKKLSWQIGD